MSVVLREAAFEAGRVARLVVIALQPAHFAWAGVAVRAALVWIVAPVWEVGTG